MEAVIKRLKGRKNNYFKGNKFSILGKCITKVMEQSQLIQLPFRVIRSYETGVLCHGSYLPHLCGSFEMECLDHLSQLDWWPPLGIHILPRDLGPQPSLTPCLL